MQPTHRSKCSAYGPNALALEHAAKLGADDCILVNTAGRVMETCLANIFAVIDDSLVTPPIADGGLGGVMREWLMHTEDVHVRSLSLRDLTAASEVFVTSSIRLVAPVRRLVLGEQSVTFETPRADHLSEQLWSAMPIAVPDGDALFQR